MVIQRRPHCSATKAVVPEPQVGSSTRSPGSVVMRRQRSTTSCDRLNDVDLVVGEAASAMSVQMLSIAIDRKVVEEPDDSESRLPSRDRCGQPSKAFQSRSVASSSTFAEVECLALEVDMERSCFRLSPGLVRLSCAKDASSFGAARLVARPSQMPSVARVASASTTCIVPHLRLSRLSRRRAVGISRVLCSSRYQTM